MAESETIPRCERFNVVDDVQRESMVTLTAEGEENAFETVARVESDDGSRTFSSQALRDGTARLTARRDFYIVTFITRFFSVEETTVTLGIEFDPEPPVGGRCTVSGKRGDRLSMVILDLEVATPPAEEAEEPDEPSADEDGEPAEPTTEEDE